MKLEIVEGTMEPARPARVRRGYARFDALNITTSDGEVRQLRKIHTGEPITSEIKRGGAGRFYLTKADAAVGLFGIRRPDGTRHYANFSNIEPMLLIVGVLGLLGGVARLLGVDFPLTPAVLGILLLVFWFVLRSNRLKTKEAFDADGVEPHAHSA